MILCAKFNRGRNAGHTIVHGNKKYAFIKFLVAFLIKNVLIC